MSLKIQVYLYRRPNLRTYSIEMESYMGRKALDYLFDFHEPPLESKTLVLSFPERWLNILEQRQLLNRIKGRMPWVEEVTIKTHSVYIIQTCKAEDMLIVEKEGSTLPAETDEGVLYTENAMDLFKEGVLNVLN